jgi:hypothetical protein
MTQETEPPLIRSRYRFTIHPAKGIHWPVVTIVDCGPFGVGNDLDDVLSDLRAQGVDPEAHRVIYRDCSGVWEELDVGPDGSLSGLRPLDESTEREALVLLRRRSQEEWDAMDADRKQLEAGE